MTDKDAREILRREYYRVVERLSEVDPVLSPKLYRELLEFADRLHWQSEEPCLVPVMTVDEITEEVKTEPIPDVEEPKADPVPAPEPEPDPEPAPEPEDKTYSKEEVRAALAESRNKGVDVPALLKEFGYSNFSAVPAGKYSEIMAKLAKKKKEKN